MLGLGWASVASGRLLSAVWLETTHGLINVESLIRPGCKSRTSLAKEEILWWLPSFKNETIWFLCSVLAHNNMTKFRHQNGNQSSQKLQSIINEKGILKNENEIEDHGNFITFFGPNINKPERVFRLYMWCRELDIFQILGIFSIFFSLSTIRLQSHHKGQ